MLAVEISQVLGDVNVMDSNINVPRSRRVILADVVCFHYISKRLLVVQHCSVHGHSDQGFAYSLHTPSDVVSFHYKSVGLLVVQHRSVHGLNNQGFS